MTLARAVFVEIAFHIGRVHGRGRSIDMLRILTYNGTRGELAAENKKSPDLFCQYSGGAGDTINHLSSKDNFKVLSL